MPTDCLLNHVLKAQDSVTVLCFRQAGTFLQHVFLHQVSRPTPCLFLRWASRPLSRVVLLQGGSQPTPCLFPANVLSVPGSADASSGPESVPGWANASTTPEPADASPVPGSTNASTIPGPANTTPRSNQPIIPIWIIFLLDLPAAFSHFVLLCQLLCPPPMSLLNLPYKYHQRLLQSYVKQQSCQWRIYKMLNKNRRKKGIKSIKFEIVIIQLRTQQSYKLSLKCA